MLEAAGGLGPYKFVRRYEAVEHTLLDVLFPIGWDIDRLRILIEQFITADFLKSA